MSSGDFEFSAKSKMQQISYNESCSRDDDRGLAPRIELRKRGRSGLGVGKCLEEIEQPDQLKRLHNKLRWIDQLQ